MKPGYRGREPEYEDGHETAQLQEYEQEQEPKLERM